MRLEHHLDVLVIWAAFLKHGREWGLHRSTKKWQIVVLVKWYTQGKWLELRTSILASLSLSAPGILICEFSALLHFNSLFIYFCLLAHDMFSYIPLIFSHCFLFALWIWDQLFNLPLNWDSYLSYFILVTRLKSMCIFFRAENCCAMKWSHCRFFSIQLVLPYIWLRFFPDSSS